jgi:hypothetical protein
MGAADQFTSNSSPLERFIHREVREVRAIAEIRDRPRDTHEPSFHPSRRDDVGVAKHRAYDVGTIDGAPFSKGGPDEHVDEFVRLQIRFKRIGRVHASERSTRRLTYGFGAGVTVMIVDVPVPTTPAAGGDTPPGGASGFVGAGIVVPGA